MKSIRLSKSSIGEEEKKAVLAVLENEYLGMGENVLNFEKKLTSFFGREAICVSTGTAALQLALECAGIGKGDEVLVPSLTYVASFQAISATGATPIACDIEERYLSIDVEDAKQRLTKNTKAIMVVHYGGVVGDFEKVSRFAKNHGLRLVEDAAHAFGSEYLGEKVGSFGDIACFSFDGIKNITSGEGGCIVSNDSMLLERAKDARLLGVEKDSQARYSGERSWEFDVVHQGWRYHMSNIMAAIGSVQLDRLDEFSKKRKQLAQYYVSKLSSQNEVIPICQDFSTIVPHIFVVRILGLKNREKLRLVLKNRGVETGVHYKPNHRLSYFKSETQTEFKTLERLFPELLSLPIHPDLSLKDIDYVLDSIFEAINER